ncbi:glycosyltransferase [Streptococcus pneumoniae]
MLEHTFVVSAYGESPFLEECIQSLIHQTVPSEIFVYIHKTNSYVEEVCQKYGLLLKTGQGGGIGRDWNQAMSFVSTPYVTIAHQDDLYEHEYTKSIIEKFRQYKDATIVFSDYAEYRDQQVVPPNRNLKIKTWMLRTMSLFPSSKFWKKRVLALGNPICCPAVSYNRAKLSGFSFREDLKTSLDWYAWYDINEHYQGRFVYIPEKLMYHRIHGDSETTATISDNTRSKEDMYMYQLMWPSFIASFLMKFYEKSQHTNSQ